jgi:hypothetical protein
MGFAPGARLFPVARSPIACAMGYRSIAAPRLDSRDDESTKTEN